MSFRCVNTLRHSLPVLLTSDFLVGLLAFCIFNGSFQVSVCTYGCVLLGLPVLDALSNQCVAVCRCTSRRVCAARNMAAAAAPGA